MTFNTWTFALFFAVFYPIHLAVRRTRLGVPWLLAASYFFYGWLDPRYPLLVAYATVVDYLLVLGMSRSRRKGPWLVLSIVNDLGLLSYFKYSAFVVDNFVWIAGLCGFTFEARAGAMLPVGISFFVFRSLTYTIDCYRGTLPREKNVLTYAAFVAFFPELLMGPIDRAAALLPQLRRAPAITGRDVADGLSLFVVGLFKKVALADYLALYVKKVYDAPAEYQSPALALATFVFAWQIYFDFSGYSDMARGIGRLLGYRLALNFDNPYLATGLGDFWRRWHITLSNWFKDYVYIPLGGNRRGTALTYANMAATMVISGLWHGAVWTFVIWGGVHAAGRTLTRALEQTGFYRERVPKIAKQLLTFAIVCFAWIFFKAASVDDAFLIVGRIFACQWADPGCPPLMLVLIACVWAYQYVRETRFRALLALAPVRIALMAGMLVWLAVVAGSSGQGFVYEQF